MKPTVISAEALFEEHRPALHWEWIAGHAHPERRFDEAAVRNAHRLPTWSAISTTSIRTACNSSDGEKWLT